MQFPTAQLAPVLQTSKFPKAWDGDNPEIWAGAQPAFSRGPGVRSTSPATIRGGFEDEEEGEDD